MGMMERITTERYTYRGLRSIGGGPLGPGTAALAVFEVAKASGHAREELLRLHVIEARALLWEDAARHDPHLERNDPVGRENYGHYVMALVEVLKRDLV